MKNLALGPQAAAHARPRHRYRGDRRRDPRAHLRGARLRARGAEPAHRRPALPRPPVRRRAGGDHGALRPARACHRVRRGPALRGDPLAPRGGAQPIGEILVRFYLNGAVRHRFLNGDPHPGNTLFLDDGPRRLPRLRVRQAPARERGRADDRLDDRHACRRSRRAPRGGGAGWRAARQSRARAAHVRELQRRVRLAHGRRAPHDPLGEDGRDDAGVHELRNADGFEDLVLPAEHFVLLRGVMLVLGVLGSSRRRTAGSTSPASGSSEAPRPPSWASRRPSSSAACRTP